MQRLTIYFIVLTAFLCIASQVHAKFNPLDTPNNKYGILTVDPNDMSEISTLVNSSGGDWGYVTLVIQEDDRKKEKWQAVFDRMRREHLIPLVRLATHIEGDSWKKPSTESISDWMSFLNALNWPIENRYVILFNEPNHANEWGKSIDPQGYAQIATKFAEALHKASEDYFVLPAGLDVSASSDGRSLDAGVYLKQMYQAKPELFDLLDGWTSHSYPNPAFSGSANATGRGSVRSYIWETSYLRSFGVTKSYPIFITETGWMHSFGVTNNFGLFSSETVGQLLQRVSNTAWSDKNIVAITPFIFSYQGLPFDHFSWRKLGSSEYYPHYYAYQSIQKTRGIPFQREHYSLVQPLIPEKLVANSSITLTGTVVNNGQSIISQDNGYTINLDGPKDFTFITESLPTIEPNETGEIKLHLEAPNSIDTFAFTLTISHDERASVLQTGNIKLIAPPAVELHIQLGWKKNSSTTDATVLLYEKDELIHKIQGVSVTNGIGTVSNLTNVIPNTEYRIVVLVPNYLPRQKIITIKEENSVVKLPRMYPFDIDADGAFTLYDIWSMLFVPPREILQLFVAV